MQSQSTILIVDDDPAGRDTLEGLLLQYGYQLEFASDGAEALAKARQLTPDLILLDVMMPGMDGFEVCRHLRKDSLVSNVPIIIVTALDDQQSRLEGLEAGADDFISKPFNRAELRARIRTIIRLNRYRHLLDERARFEWVIEHAQDGFLIVSTNDALCYANTQACNYLNLPCPFKATDDTTSSFLALVSKHYMCEPHEAWENWLSDTAVSTPTERDQPVRYLVRPETPTAQALWLQVSRINLSKSATENLIRLHDVTDQMTRQRQIWTFHSLLSHKLNTPLSVLMNSLYFLRQADSDMTLEQVADIAQVATQSVERLHRQLTNIRQYLRMAESTRYSEHCRVVHLETIITQISQEMELDTITISGLDTVQHSMLVLSPQSMELIMRQVLENAKKFHPQQAPVIDISFHTTSDPATLIRIRDNGTSLSPEQLSAVWLPYYQAEKSFSGEVPGMGLGLAMVAATLWNVGGHYHIANRDPGPGVEVQLVIPLLQDTEEEEEQWMNTEEASS